MGQQELENLSAYQDKRRKRRAWIQHVQGAPIRWLCFLMRYEELSSVDSELGQGDKNFERVENFEIVTWKT